MIEFFVPLIPTAKGRPRFSRRGRAFTDAKTETAEITFSSLAAPNTPPKPLEGPVVVSLHFTLPIPAGWPRWKRETGPWFHSSRPDVDNLGKLALDALQRSGQWWHDDCQVASLSCSKQYGAQPGTRVSILALEQPMRPNRSKQ